jgi:hypothetical protein
MQADPGEYSISAIIVVIIIALIVLIATDFSSICISSIMWRLHVRPFGSILILRKPSPCKGRRAHPTAPSSWTHRNWAP